MQKHLFLVIKALFALYVLLMASIWLVSPYLISTNLNKQLATFNLNISKDASWSLNPFIFRLVAKDVELVSTNKLAKSSEETRSQLNKLIVDIDIFSLVNKTLTIKELTIDGLLLPITINDTLITIAGIELPQNQTSTKQETTDKKAPKDEEAQANNYQVFIENTKVINSNINLAFQDDTQHIAIDKLSIQDSSLSALEQQINLDGKLTLNNAPFAFNIRTELVNGNGPIALSSTLEQFPLSTIPLPNDIKKVQGELTFAIKQDIQLNGSHLSIKSNQLNLFLADLLLITEQAEIELAKQEVNIQSLSIESIEQEYKVTGLANTHSINLDILVPSSQDKLVKLSESRIDNIIFNLTSTEQTFSIQNILLNKASLSSKSQTEIPPLVNVEALNVKDVTGNANSIAIKAIELSGMDSHVTIDKDKNLVNLVDLASNSSKTAPEQQVTIDEQKQREIEQSIPFNFSLGHFALTSPATIYLNDMSISPALKKQITIQSVTLSELSSTKPELISKLTSDITIDDYANIEITSDLQPFLDVPKFKLQTHLKELALQELSPYLNGALQHDIKSGQLNLDLEATLTGSELDGNADILVRALDLTSANDIVADSLKDKTAIPFATALGMLKNSDGNIKLELPISGNIDEPSFGLSGFVTLLVKKATMMAAKDYLMTTFVPYAGIVNIAMVAGEQLLKVRFKDMYYPATETALTNQHDVFLQQFSSLMKDKEETQITICAVATPADINRPLGIEIKDKEQIDKLTELSNQRLKTFKDYMVTEKHIPSERLILCSPQVDFSKNAKPRLSFSS